MNRTMIKICGITSPADAVMCDGLGADYLGVIFAESPRKVTVSRAGEIRRAVPGARLVGVFRDASVESVRRAVELCGLGLIQLHGSESAAYVEQLTECVGLPIVKALVGGRVAGVGGVGARRAVGGAGGVAGGAGGVAGGAGGVAGGAGGVSGDTDGVAGGAAGVSGDTDGVAGGARVAADLAAFVLFDLDKKGADGSDRSRRALWDEAAAAVRAGRRVFLAGGLTPQNVSDAVRGVRPYCVDVCSGVEAAPGVKDAAAVARFVEEVRR